MIERTFKKGDLVCSTYHNKDTGMGILLSHIADMSSYEIWEVQWFKKPKQIGSISWRIYMESYGRCVQTTESTVMRVLT